MRKKSVIPLITILIPSINEDKIIKKMVDDCFSLRNIRLEVLVIVDSRTTLRTIQAAKKTKAKIINVGESNGKGSAIRLAIPHITGAYTIQIDADYQFMPNEIPKMLDPLLAGYDVTLGTRYEKGAEVEMGSVSLSKRMGSYGLSYITSLFAKKRITDVMAGFKGFKTPVLKKLDPQVNHFGYEAELVIKAAQQRYTIKNVPITYRKRTQGTSNVANVKHGLLVLQTIIVTGFQKK